MRTKPNTCVKENRIYLSFREPQHKIIYVFRPRCWCWNCAGCAKARANRWAQRMYYVVNKSMSGGQDWYFVTLTSHENCRNFEQTKWVMKKAFPKLYKRMLRKFPDLMYVAIPEPHKDGRLHIHILTNAGMRTRWYKDNARECGFGYEADAKKMDDPRRAAFYAVKYIVKSLTSTQLEGKRFQRVRASKGLPELPEREDFTKNEVEIIGNARDLLRYVMMNEREGWELIDLETGDLL